MIRLSPKNPLSLAFDIALGLRGVIEEAETMDKALKGAGSGQHTAEHSSESGARVITPEQLEAQGVVRF